MMKFKSEKGITIISLIITIIVLTIIAGVVIYMGITGAKEVNDSKLNTELQMVQHAVLEQYAKYKTTRDNAYLIGDKLEQSQVTQIANELGIQLDSNKDYYKLNKAHLKEIGIKDSDDEYIVNYISGEVINFTQKRLSTKTPLYIKSNSF